LAAGEPAVVLDSGQPAELVLGDGVTAMTDLRRAVWGDDARLAAVDAEAATRAAADAALDVRVDALDVTTADIAADIAAVDARQQVATALTRKPLRVFASEFEETYPGSGTLREWTTAHTDTASHTVAASTRQDGGNTLTLVDATTTGLALVKSKAFHGHADRAEWYTTDEITHATNQTFTFRLLQGAATRAQLIVNGAGAGTIQLNADDGLGAQTSPNVSTAKGFASTTPYRIGIWYDASTGTARFYLFAGSGSGADSRHIFLGERVNTAIPWPITAVQVNSGQVNVGNITLARVEGFEVLGVIHGCSTDSPNAAWDQSPAAFPLQSRFNDSAAALALRLWGQREGIVNMTHGSWTVENMETGGLLANGEDTATWANMVTALRPRLVVLGSGVNSVAAAAALAPPSVAATDRLDSAKAAYLRLIDASFAADAYLVCVRNVSPVGGHVSFATSAQLDLVDDWNAWVDTIPAMYPTGHVVVSDVWSALVDPGVARTLLPRYDIGDHLHYTVSGGEALADADADAITGSGAL